MSNLFFRYLRCFFTLIVVFSAGLILVYLIPNEALEPQFSKSIAQVDKEDLYAGYLFDADGAILDNFMDKLMVRTCHINESYDNIIKAAFDNNGYPRYWNGYLLTLRPLLSQFTWQQIRYINMFCLLTAFCFCFSAIQHEFSATTAIGFAVSIIACFLVFIGESLQYFSVFMILFLILLALLYIPRFKNYYDSLLLLFAAGMLTNFFDMLTAPLLTLGIPLILILERESRKNTQLIKSIRRMIAYSVSWGMGYGLTWAIKWAIGTLVLGYSIFEDAMKTAQFRVSGSEAYPLDRVLMFRLNFNTYFFSKGHKPFAILVIVLLLLAVRMIRSRRNSWFRFMIPILLTGIYPFIWFLVFANHSQLHYFYTYRIQAISLFAVFSAISAGSRHSDHQ